MVAVSHENGTANLYISNKEATKFSLSLPSILYYEEAVSGNYFGHDFVDMIRVKGVSGVYIATNLTDTVKRYLVSWITFNNGREWTLLKPPATQTSKNCSYSNGCSLHVSHENGYHAFTRFSPMYSKKSAPGFILATGNVGRSLSRNPYIYLSTDAGMSWKVLFEGHYFYGFVDHGGIILAVKKYGKVDTLQYSWNEGHSWNVYRFTDTPMRVYGLLTKPGEKTTIFTVFGSKPEKHSWLIIQIDMKDVLECKRSADSMTCDRERHCYMKSEKCDGIYDCTDRTDELNCPTTTYVPFTDTVPCPRNRYRCDGGRVCYDYEDICNSIVNCRDRSDEENCNRRKVITTLRPSCNDSSFSCKEGGCITRDSRCDGIRDCKFGEDENDCNEIVSCKLPKPFKFTCDQVSCFNASVQCNGHANCDDNSDEDKSICDLTKRVNKLTVVNKGNDQLLITWEIPKLSVKFKDFQGYRLKSISLYDAASEYNTQKPKCLMSGLQPCTEYLIAVAVNLKSLNNKLLYVDVTGDTGGYRKPDPELEIEVTEQYLRWKENNRCTYKYTGQLQGRELLCWETSDAIDPNPALRLKIPDSQGFIRPQDKLPNNTRKGQYNCQVTLTYADFQSESRFFNFPLSDVKRGTSTRTNKNATTTYAPYTSTVPCPRNRYKCDGGRVCYDYEDICNNIVDCRDRSDEKNCNRRKVITTFKPSCNDSSFSCKEGGCITRDSCCDGIRDCKFGEDENDCNEIVSCKLPKPFKFTCDQVSCFNASVQCNGHANCDDNSDEDKSICDLTKRVNKLTVVNKSNNQLLITWKNPKLSVKFRDFQGYRLKSISLYDAKNKLTVSEYNTQKPEFLMSGLQPCTEYLIAVAINLKSLKNKLLYADVTGDTGGYHKPDRQFEIEVTENYLRWKENNRCTYKYTKQLQKRELICWENIYTFAIDPNQALRLTISESEGFIRPQEKFPKNTRKGQYNCRVTLTYADFRSESKSFSFPLSDMRLGASTGTNNNGKDNRGKNNTNVLVWAIPVALVGIALVLGLVVIVFKYMHLQHSVLAFAACGSYTRHEDREDGDNADNMVVLELRTGEDHRDQQII